MSTSLRVLIVEASEADAASLVNELRHSGYDLTFQQVDTATAMTAALDQQEWDIVIAKHFLPQFSASAALSLLKQRELDIPFITVSQVMSEDNALFVTAVEQELREAEMRLVHKQTEETLRESEANLLALIENTQDSVWSVDTEHRLVTLNSNFKKSFSLSFQMIPTKGMDMVACLPEELQTTWRGFYNRALQGERFSVEQHYDLDEQSVEFEISFNPIRTDQARITGVAVFSRDITDRKRAEAVLQQTNDQLQAVLDAVPGCVSWFSSDLTYLGINRYLAATFNMQAEDFIGKKIGFLDSSGKFGEFVHDFFASSLKESAVEMATQVDGATRSYLMVAQKYYQDQAAVFIGIDITDRKQVEEALRESQERYALAVRGANDGLWDWNLRTNEIYFAPRWKSMLGCEDHEIYHSPDEWFNRVHPDDIGRLRAQISLHFKGLALHFESEHRMLHKDGTYRWMLSRGLAVRDKNGQASRMAGSQTDITERKQAEEQLLHDAFHDALTDLPNRALFIDRLGQAIKRSKRPGSSLFAVLFLDLDRFKVVNDSIGHMIGDQLLIEIARRLETCLRSGDTVARLGGDEFVMLLHHIKDLSGATQVAEQIHQALESPFNLNGHEVFTTASIGIALSETGYERPEDLLRDADIAMYRAKALGRGRHEVFDIHMHARAVALLQLETALRRAIERQEFRVYYQPILLLETGRIIGFEALVRWQHPERGIVSPAEFIPIMEETGLIIPLGAWVLREACRQTRVWQMQFSELSPLTISVNLSGKQFSQLDLIQQVDQILQETGLEPHHLKLEITESVVMENAESAIAMLFQLKALGLHLQIDDFGTGYSSLSYLHRLPTDMVKIDQSFVSRMGTTDDSCEIVKAIITLAHNLGMAVTAEGIETREQMVQLTAMGSEYGQGFFFSRPVDAQAAEVLILAELQQCGLETQIFT